MQQISTSYFFVLLCGFAHATLPACQAEQSKQKKLDADFFKAAGSNRLNPTNKYQQLSTLLAKKANIATSNSSGKTALYNLIEVAGKYKRNDNKSIKLLVDSKSPLSTNNPIFSVVERAIHYTMYPALRILVSARADLNEPTGPMFGHSCLHQIAAAKWNNDTTRDDTTACEIFDILKQHDTLPVENLTLYHRPGYSALHFSRGKAKVQLTRRLLAHGANPYCPQDNCHEKDDADTRAVHEKWKAEARTAVLVKIPVNDVVQIVVDYYF